MTRDWHAWHTEYDDPGSSLSRRLVVVRDQVRQVLRDRPDVTQVVSLCAGDGRDVLPVLAELGADVDVLLVELDPDLADAARRTAAELRLDRVVVRTADAGSTDVCADHTPAQVLLACGIFGNITDADAARTVAALPSLVDDGGVVVWTRGHRAPHDPTAFEGDPSEHVRDLFVQAGFDEVAFVRPDDAGFRVGVHRLRRPAVDYRPGLRMFTFV